MADSTAWIHIDDMVNGILWLLDNDLRGPFNMVSPYPVHNEQFAHALGHALHRPAIFRVPAAAIRLLMGNPPSWCSAASARCQSVWRPPALPSAGTIWTKR